MPQCCMVFPQKDRCLDIHEIERRSACSKRWMHRSNYLLLCRRCHRLMGTAAWPHARQLALKLRRDPQHYDLDAWLRLADPELKAPDRVTQAEVEQWVERDKETLEL